MESFKKTLTLWRPACIKLDPQDPYALCQQGELDFLSQKLRFIGELKTTQDIHTCAQSINCSWCYLNWCYLNSFSLLKHIGISWNEMSGIWSSAQTQKNPSDNPSVRYHVIFHRQYDSRKRTTSPNKKERMQVLLHNIFEEGCQATSFSTYSFPLSCAFFLGAQ